MGKRLIDAKALGIGYCNPLVFDKVEYAHGWNCAIEIIEKAPTVDAVEVVRCKDCIWYGKVHELNACTRIYGFPIAPIMPDDYCSNGVRKQDD